MKYREQMLVVVERERKNENMRKTRPGQVIPASWVCTLVTWKYLEFY